MKKAPMPWTLAKNNWRYTTIYDAEGNPVCRLDLEDWSVTEDNQAALEAVQARIAWRIVDAVNAIIDNESQEDLILRLLGEFKDSIGSAFDDKIKYSFIAGARAALWKNEQNLAAEVACRQLCSNHGFATGHGDTVADMIGEIDAQITKRLAPREIKRLSVAHNAAVENIHEAWSALAMIRETIENLGPVGAVQSSEHLDGPTFMHEAEALVSGIRAIAALKP